MSTYNDPHFKPNATSCHCRKPQNLWANTAKVCFLFMFQSDSNPLVTVFQTVTQRPRQLPSRDIYLRTMLRSKLKLCSSHLLILILG